MLEELKEKVFKANLHGPCEGGAGRQSACHLGYG